MKVFTISFNQYPNVRLVIAAPDVDAAVEMAKHYAKELQRESLNDYSISEADMEKPNIISIEIAD